MNRKEFVDAISEATGQSKNATSDFVNAFCDVVANELSNGGEVQLVGFGGFSITEVDAREGRNPQTGATIQIPASKRVKFRAGKPLKDKVNS